MTHKVPGRGAFYLAYLKHRCNTSVVSNSIPTTMKTIIAVLALLVAPQLASAQALPISFPEGVTIANATPQQLADAVAAAIQANPGNAQAIATSVATAIAGLPNASAMATALATAIATNVPPAQVAAVIAAAAAAAANAGNAGLAATMAAAAASAVPSQSTAIANAVAEAVPAEAGNIANAVAPGAGSTTTTSFPTTTQNTTQNPANFSGGQTNSPSN